VDALVQVNSELTGDRDVRISTTAFGLLLVTSSAGGSLGGLLLILER
jgi:hypothetical protein